MASRRDLIAMDDDEVRAFLATPHQVMNVATIGKDGRPHLVAMWYGFLEGDLAFWTYGRSQKIVNLRRDPRCTCLVEAGEAYDELRGVELVCTGEVVEDREQITDVGASVYDRYTGPYTPEARPLVEAMGAKRLAVRLRVDDVVSWDHRKLGGGY